MSALSDPGPRPELAWLPVERLTVDPRYQRDTELRGSQRLIARIRDNFRWSRFQAILVTRTETAWVIIDGQHRVAAARLRGFDLVPSVVISGADLVEQATAFVWANRVRQPISAQVIFRAQLVAGDPIAALVHEVATAAGIRLLHYPFAAGKTPAGQTSAVASMLEALRLYGEPAFRSSVAALGACFGAMQGGLRPAFFLAAARYIKDGGDDAGLRRALDRLGPERLAVSTTSKGTNSAVPELVAAIGRAGGVAIGAATPAPAPVAATPPPAPTAEPTARPQRGRPAFRFEDDPRPAPTAARRAATSSAGDRATLTGSSLG